MKESIYNKLTQTSSVSKSSYFWSAFSATLNSFQTTVLLLFITRSGNIEDSSIFVIAYAVANLLLTIGKFGVRNYQVTDQKKKYTDQEYIDFRKITVFFMMIVMIAYLIYGVICNNYNLYKFLCMLFICSFKVVEAYEDVYHGKLQQIGRLDIASKALSVRYTLFYTLFIICYLVTNNLLISSFFCFLLNLILFVYLNLNVLKSFFIRTVSNRNHVKALLFELFPLALTSILIMYIANAPKYLIDGIVSDKVQTSFNIVFMPVFVIALFGTYVFNPMIKDLSDLYQKKEYKRFVNTIIKLIILILIITFAVVIVGNLIGLKILSLIYNVNLNDWTLIFIILLIAGGILAILNLMNIVYTILRKQKLLLMIFLVGSLSFFFLGNHVFNLYDLLGVSFLFCGILGLILFCLLFFMFYIIKSSLEENGL